MSSNEQCRTNAEDCLRKARTLENDRDKPFWLNLAQSWLQLAEQRSRNKLLREPARPSDQH